MSSGTWRTWGRGSGVVGQGAQQVADVLRAALARVYAALTHGGELDGAHLVTPARIDQMQVKTWDAPDRVLIGPVRKGIGFFLGGLGPDMEGNLVPGPMGPSEATFGHPGAGGSIGFADPERGLAVAVVSNKMAFPAPGQGTTQDICDLLRTLADDA